MDIKEVQDAIKCHTILSDSGLERWPGMFMNLDVSEIFIDGRKTSLKIKAWFELDNFGTPPKVANCFIVNFDYTYIIVDWFYLAKDIWDYYLDLYKDKSL